METALILEIGYRYIEAIMMILKKGKMEKSIVSGAE